MASTITDAVMTVTLKESVTLNGSEQGATNTLTISGINEVYKRIVTVPTSEVTLIEMSTAVANGTFIESDVLYIRITNKNNDYHVSLTFKGEGNEEFGLLLDKGQSFIYNGDLVGGVVNTMDAHSGAITPGTLLDLVNITAIADTAAVDVEIFVACK